LVEVAHASVLPGSEPFVAAQQATQVYYIPYPCKSVPDLEDWWVVYKVQPPGKLPIPLDQDYDFVPNTDAMDFFQEDLEGTFEVNLGEGLDSILLNLERDGEDVVDVGDLELLKVQDCHKLKRLHWLKILRMMVGLKNYLMGRQPLISTFDVLYGCAIC
jgi:hypothetical protein